MTNYESSLLYQDLCSFGDVIPLSIYLDAHKITSQLTPYESEWSLYNPKKPFHRYALSLYSLTGDHKCKASLGSIREYNIENKTSLTEMDFCKPTKLIEEVTALSPLQQVFGGFFGRTHLLKLEAGGFFPPHRDGYGISKDTFRVFCPLENSSHHNFVFLLEGQPLQLEVGRVYFINTRKVHAVFAFDRCIQLVANLRLCTETIQALMKNMQHK